MTIYQAFFGGTFDKDIHFGHYFSIMSARIHAEILLYTDPLFHDLNFNPLLDNVQLAVFMGANKSADYDGKETELSIEDRLKLLDKIFGNLYLIPLTGEYSADIEMRFRIFDSLHGPIIMYFGPDQREKEWAVKLRADISKGFPNRTHFYWIVKEFEPKLMRSSVFNPSELTIEELAKYGENVLQKITEQNYLYGGIVERIED